MLVVETDRDRKDFIADVAEIIEQLNRRVRIGGRQALSYEGFFFEAQDEHGPFVGAETVHRGHIEGGQWSACPGALPYLTLGTFSSDSEPRVPGC